MKAQWVGLPPFLENYSIMVLVNFCTKELWFSLGMKVYLQIFLNEINETFVTPDLFF